MCSQLGLPARSITFEQLAQHVRVLPDAWTLALANHTRAVTLDLETPLEYLDGGGGRKRKHGVVLLRASPECCGGSVLLA
jgi:hypothetical protein